MGPCMSWQIRVFRVVFYLYICKKKTGLGKAGSEEVDGTQSGLRSATTRSAKIPCKYIKTPIWCSSEVHGMVGMGPDGLEIVANYAAGLRSSTIKSLKKKKKTSLWILCKECVIEIYYTVMWHGSTLGPLVWGCLCSAVHKRHLHGRNGIRGKLGTIGAPLTSISGTFV